MTQRCLLPGAQRIVVKEGVGPYPRRYGAIVRYPAPHSCVTASSHVRGSSGNPCRRITGTPYSGPDNSQAISSVAVRTRTTVG